jgi:signal transduction histidine kinase
MFRPQLMHPELLTEILASCIQEGVLVLNHSDIIEFANTAAATCLGFSSYEELVGKHIGEVYSDSEGPGNLLAQLAGNEKTIGYENTCGSLNGQMSKAAYSVSIINEGQIHGPVKVITFHDSGLANKRAEMTAEYTRKLEKSNKELDQFAYIVSHDLKAPLRAISNLSSWLKDDLSASLSGENLSNLDMLRARVKRMESLINGILEYSKIGREHTPAETIDVSRLIDEVVETLSPPSHIKIEVSTGMPVMQAPKILMFQIFSNLISNAIKFNDKKEGLVRIGSSEKKDSYEFTVEDNGAGIPEAYFEKIFVIFQTLQARDKFESTGIGLTIVKRILNEKGGSIRVESQVGKGSKFIFAWPRKEKNIV